MDTIIEQIKLLLIKTTVDCIAKDMEEKIKCSLEDMGITADVKLDIRLCGVNLEEFEKASKKREPTHSDKVDLA